MVSDIASLLSDRIHKHSSSLLPLYVELIVKIENIQTGQRVVLVLFEKAGFREMSKLIKIQ